MKRWEERANVESCSSAARDDDAVVVEEVAVGKLGGLRLMMKSRAKQE